MAERVTHRWSGPYHDRLEYILDGRALTMEEIKGYINTALCARSIVPLAGDACERIYNEAFDSARGEGKRHQQAHQAALVNVYAAGQRSVSIPERGTEAYNDLLWHIAGCPSGQWDSDEIDNMAQRVFNGLRFYESEQQRATRPAT